MHHGIPDVVTPTSTHLREDNGLSGELAPRVSIGLPVYNGEEFLEEAIVSILSQTYEDFELIISDNASTDLTEKICRKYAAHDSRIVYLRNVENIGVTKNHNLTFRQARGEYFRFAGYDDRLAPTFLERLIVELDSNPGATLSFAATVLIDGKGNETGVRCSTEGTAATAPDRFREALFTSYPGEPLYGLIRSDVLRQTALHRSYTGSDYTLMCELALRGPFHHTPEPLFFNRHHDRNVYKDLRGRMAWARPDLAKSGRPTLPYWLRLADYIGILWHAPLSLKDRASCTVSLVRWIGVKWRSLGWDVGLAVLMLVRGKKWRIARYAPERWQY
jgi:glycosyltransferase involved in cell wall biosynthesis